MGLVTLGASFFAGTYLNFSSYITWMYEDPAWGPQIIPTPLEGDIDDYFRSNWFLHKTTREIVNNMTTEEKVGQLLMPAWEADQTLDEIAEMIQDMHLGGVMVLRDGTTPGETAVLRDLVQYQYNDERVEGWLAIDAEPSLVRYRVDGIEIVPDTNQLQTTEEVKAAAQTIGEMLQQYRYNLNFAPVYDSNHNQSVIGHRSFGSTTGEIVSRAGMFSQTMKEMNIIPTAKHFPGHGSVTGDTHYALQELPGEIPELDTFNQSIQNQDTPMMMIGHLAVSDGTYGTKGVPASLSPVIIKDLLRNELGFRGLVITDGMNMQALDTFPDRSIAALEAGNDILLMPRDIEETYSRIVERADNDTMFAEQINQSVYRIVRLKLVQQWASQ